MEIETNLFKVESTEYMEFKPLKIKLGEDLNEIQNKVNRELSRVQRANYYKGRLDMINCVLYDINQGHDLAKVEKSVKEQKQFIKDMYRCGIAGYNSEKKAY